MEGGHPPPYGPWRQSLEGEEFEGELEDGERAWLEPEEVSAIWAEEAEQAETLALEAAQDGEQQAEAIVARDETISSARRSAKLHASLQSLRELGVPASANLVSQQISRVQKSVRCASHEGQAQAKELLRASVNRAIDAERAAIKAKQREIEKRRKSAAHVNAKKRKVAKLKSQG